MVAKLPSRLIQFSMYSTSSDFTLRALPYLTEEYTKQAEKITSAFLGDPSFFAYNGEDPDAEPEEEDPDAPPVERFREMNRLTYTVNVSLMLVTFTQCSVNLF